MKIIKWVIYLIISIPVVVIAAFIGLVTFVDPNDYQGEIEQAALEQGNIKIVLNGDIGWSFFPNLGFSLTNISVYEQIDSSEVIASVGEMVLSLQLLPLITGTLEVNGIALSQFDANLRIDEQGVANWSKLAQSKEQNTSKPANRQVDSENNKNVLDKSASKSKDQQQAEEQQKEASVINDTSIESIVISHATINYSDQQQEQTWNLTITQLEVDDFTFGKPFAIKAKLSVAGSNPVVQADIDLDSHLSIDKLLTEVIAEKSTLTISANTDFLPGGTQNVDITFSAQANLDKKTFSLPITFAFDVLLTQLAAERQKISLVTTISGNYEALEIQAKDTDVQAEISYPELFAKTQQVRLQADKVNASITRERIKINKADITLPQLTTTIAAELTSFSDPEAQLSLAINIFNPRDLAELLLINGEPATKLIPPMAGKQALTAMALQAQAGFSGDLLTLDEFTLIADTTTLEANASYSITKNRVNANLAIDAIHIDNYLPPKSPEQTQSENESSKVESSPNPKESEQTNTDTPTTVENIYSKESIIPLELVDLVNADIIVEVGQIQLFDQTMKNTTVKLTNANKKLVTTLKAQGFKGSIDTKASLNTQAERPVIRINNRLRNIELSQVLAMVQDEAFASGKGNITTNIHVRGNSVYDWTRSVTGPLSLSINEGKLLGINISKEICSAIYKVGGSGNKQFNWPTYTPINKLQVQSNFNNGQLTIARADAVLPDAKGLITGKANIATLDFDIPAEFTITGTAQDNKCKAPSTLQSIDWPIICKGNVLTTNPATFCRPNFDLLTKKVSELAQIQIDNAKKNLQAQIDAEKQKAKKEAEEKIAAEKQKLQQEVDRKKAEIQADLEKRKKAEEEKLKNSLQEKLLDLF